ncbi:hypothetical protein HDU89_000262 [Geranomyces variabilis]|nr:hypothetical protein HDU89_000262 [Geranomyces variabilis]
MMNHHRRPKSACWDSPVALSLPRTGISRGFTTSVANLDNDYIASRDKAADARHHSDAPSTLADAATVQRQWQEEQRNANESNGKLSIPRRLDSKDPLNAKRYSELTPEELDALSLAALKRLNAVFKHFKFRPLPPDVLKTIDNDTAGRPKSKRFLWWKPWSGAKLPGKHAKRDEHAAESETAPSVLGLHLPRSVDVVSAPLDAQPTVNRRIPVVIAECIRYIKAEGLDATGLFRVNGSERRMAQLAVVFDTAPLYGRGISFEGYSVYDVAGFVKRYLRIIPEPLLTTELYPHFLRCLDVPAETGTRVRAFRLLLMLLPPAHLVLLETVLELMQDIIAHENINQMTSHNLARIISPNILRPKETAGKKQGLEEYERGSYVMEYLIDNWDHLAITSHDVRPFQMLDLGFANIKHPVAPVAVAAPAAEQPSAAHIEEVITDDTDSAAALSLQGDITESRYPAHALPHRQNHCHEPVHRSLAESIHSGNESHDSALSSAVESSSDGTGARLRRVRTAPTKRNRNNQLPAASVLPTVTPPAALSNGVQLTHTPSSQSLQSLNHYTQSQQLRRKASLQRHQIIQAKLAAAPEETAADPMGGALGSYRPLQTTLTRKNRIQPPPLPSPEHLGQEDADIDVPSPGLDVSRGTGLEIKTRRMPT